MHAAPIVAHRGDVVPGTLVGGRFVIRAVHGAGGCAVVYRATDTATDTDVAVKVLHKDLARARGALRRFRREAQLLNRLSHPHIVQVLDTGETTDGRPFIAMQWLPGPTLADEVRRRGRFTCSEALATLKPLASALGCAHDRGIVHRDVKPTNVIAIPDGAWFSPVLVDFGIARLIAPSDPPSASLSSIVGTPLTMAPEQLLGEPSDARTDVYALGLMLFELLTGEPPFRGDHPAQLEELHLDAPAPRVSSRVPVSAAIDDAVARCLAKRPAARFATVAQMLEALRPEPSPATHPLLAAHVTARPRRANAYDDATLDALEAFTEHARAALVARGADPPMVTSSSVVATRPLAPSPASALAAWLSPMRALLQDFGTVLDVRATLHAARDRDEALRPGRWTLDRAGLSLTHAAQALASA